MMELYIFATSLDASSVGFINGRCRDYPNHLRCWVLGDSLDVIRSAEWGRVTVSLAAEERARKEGRLNEFEQAVNVARSMMRRQPMIFIEI